tara:strand:- start:149 stop:391 length:243 start_codon:yes stop_codon:yes gene_type:complete
MGADDHLLNFKGGEASWAALCAFDGMQFSDEVYTFAQAGELIENVWEFVVQTCEKQGVDVPSKTATISELKTLISSIDND